MRLQLIFFLITAFFIDYAPYSSTNLLTPQLHLMVLNLLAVAVIQSKRRLTELKGPRWKQFQAFGAVQVLQLLMLRVLLFPHEADVQVHLENVTATARPYVAAAGGAHLQLLVMAPVVEVRQPPPKLR